MFVQFCVSRAENAVIVESSFRIENVIPTVREVELSFVELEHDTYSIISCSGTVYQVSLSLSYLRWCVIRIRVFEDDCTREFGLICGLVYPCP